MRETDDHGTFRHGGAHASAFRDLADVGARALAARASRPAHAALHVPWLRSLSGRLDAGLGKLAERSSGFADLLSTVKKAVLRAPESDIAYDAGTDLEIELTAPLAGWGMV